MVTVLLNRASGGTASVTPDQIKNAFGKEGVETAVIEFSPQTFQSALADAIRSRPAALIAAGGDGTVSALARAAVDAALPMGVLPFGTLNHFAKDLRIPLDLAGAARTIAAGTTIAVDLGEVNGHRFVNNSSIGLYPGFVEIREELRRMGHSKWAAFAMAMVRAFRNGRMLTVRLDADGKQMVSPTSFVFVGNNEYTVEGLRLGGRPALTGGRLFAYMAPHLQTQELPKLFALAVLGRARRTGTFSVFPAHELWVETPGNRRLIVSADGELLRLSTPLHYCVVPHALRVFAPAD